MSVFGFAHYYYKGNCIKDVYKACQISVIGLKFANNKFSNKEKNLIRLFFREFIILLDEWLRVMLINASQW